MKKILLLTDAWFPQVNGVVRTMNRVKEILESAGHEMRVVSPEQFRTIPCPSYPEIRLAYGRVRRRIGKIIDEYQPDHIHIVTEGPIGMAGRGVCRKRHLPFTSAYHTKFPEYIKARTGLPLWLSYRWIRWFHGPSSGMLVATQSIRSELERWGLTNCVDWTRGVDTELFQPRPEGREMIKEERPVFLYVGRVAVEKNIEAFLELDLPGVKYVVGDGPAREALMRKYPDVVFPGVKKGVELAQYFSAADVFVFPSRTDTFGLVMLEALACGVPVAAYPVPGPLDVIGPKGPGSLDEDLASACRRALEIDRTRCREYALGFSWDRCAQMYFDNLAQIDGPTRQPQTAMSSAQN